MMMNPLLIICIMVSLVHLCLGTLVYLVAPRERINRAFYLATMVLAIWILFNTATRFSWPDIDIKIWVSRLAYASGMLTATAVTTFCIIFAHKKRVLPRSLTIIWCACGLFVALALSPKMLVAGFQAIDGIYTEISGPLRMPFYATEALMFSYGLHRLWKHYRTTVFKEEKLQTMLLGVGILAPAGISLVALAILGAFYKDSDFVACVGPISTIAFIALAGLAISRRGLFIEADLASQYLFNSIAMGICMTQADRRVIKHNRKLLRLLEHEEDISGWPLDDLVALIESRTEDSSSPVREWFAKHQEESLQVTLSGRKSRILDVTTTQWTNRKGVPVGDIFVFHDVTELMMFKKAARSSQERYRMLVENANDIIYTLDLDGHFTYFNTKAAERITGHKVEEWIGRHFSELLVPGEEEIVLNHAREAYRGNAQRYEVKITHKDGTVVALWNLIDVIRVDGKPVGFSVIARDITETKKLEGQLKESEEKYRTLVEDSENIVYVIQDGYLKFINKTGIKISGYLEEELCNENFDPLDTIHPDDRPLAAEAFGALTSGQSDFCRIEVRLVTRQGRTYDFIVTGAALSYKGRPAIIGMLVDMTEKKRLHEQLIQSEKMASIGHLVSGVAHELNNPLVSIMGYAQLLSENELLPAKERRCARVIFESSERCKRIIQNLLGFARKQEINMVSVNVHEILDKTLELREYDLASDNIEIRRGYHADPHMTLGDSPQLQCVFLNLLNNASDSMKDCVGPRILSICTRVEDGTIVAEFTDTGTGIPHDFHDKVFDPFFTTKDVGQGTGLGLSISYGIIEEHGGKLSLDKSYEGGARFIVTLPVAETTGQHPAIRETPSNSSTDGTGTKILVVDDEDTILELSADILTSEGYEVDTASNGAQAKQLIQANSYDLIIADIRMPGALNGIDLFQWAKGAKPGVEKHMIFMTGDIMADDAHDFIVECKRPCLAKPFEISEYLKAIQDALASPHVHDSGNGGVRHQVGRSDYISGHHR